jgi:hypothetical protein
MYLNLNFKKPAIDTKRALTCNELTPNRRGSNQEHTLLIPLWSNTQTNLTPPPPQLKCIDFRCAESKAFLREEQRNLPSFESVLALARNEVAARNSTTAPMAAAAMPGECSSSPSSPRASCFPSPSVSVCRLQEANQLICRKENGENDVPFFLLLLPLFLYASGAGVVLLSLSHSFPPTSRCQRLRMQEFEKGAINKCASQTQKVLNISYSSRRKHTQKKTERVLHWPLLLFRVLEQRFRSDKRVTQKKSSGKVGENVLKQERENLIFAQTKSSARNTRTSIQNRRLHLC